MIAKGSKFNYWTVIAFDGVRPPLRKNAYWFCQCACGRVKSVAIAHVKNGKSKSCGCGVYKIGGEKHGLVGTPAYKSWDNMKARFYDPRSDSYPLYGGRGIQMCRAMRETPETLVRLIGQRPQKGFTVDRKDSNGHYSCGGCNECQRNGWSMNVRWATAKQQCRNRRNNVIVTIKGREMVASELAESCGVAKHLIYSRIKRGEIDASALLAPLHERKKYVAPA